MSEASIASPPAAESGEPPLRHRILEIPEKGWERLWLWGSERINPIVVKEVRQSLKSRQFTISFGLTLIAAVGWTLIAVSLLVPRIYYMPGGLPLLAGFFCILTTPLMVIIPFSAFRALTSETEESTFELLSISALTSLQIVHGKMASACLQVVLYLSALAPCIVLTYLLRGVGLFTILFLLGLTVVFSLCETALALLLASVCRSRMAQTGMSVLVLTGLLIAFFSWLGLLISEGFDEFSNPPREIYLVLFAISTVIAVAISLVLRAAAASIDFASENHSTPLRRRIIALVTLGLFWTLFGMIAAEEGSIAVAFLSGAFIIFMFFGALITGERGIISPRAQRTLPKTFMGRVFTTWQYPGAGLGYILLICLFAAIAGTLTIVDLYYEATLRNYQGNLTVMAFAYLTLCYLTIYLGFNRLALMLVPRRVPGRMVASVALLIVTLLLAHLLPLFAIYYLNDYRDFDYGWHQAFNIFWSLNVAVDRVSLDIGPSILIVTLCAIAIFGLNLVLCTRDVMLVRVALPPRIREEEQLDEEEQPLPADPFAD